jgi:hypothetical protein
MVQYNGTNVTGWTELYNGDVIKAGYMMYNTAFGGWFLLLLIAIVNIALLMKSKKPLLPFIVNGIILVGIAFTQYLTQQQIAILIGYQAILFGAVIYKWIYAESV